MHLPLSKRMSVVSACLEPTRPSAFDTRSLAMIASLERQAVAAKKREAAVAIRWIRKAIRDYGIEAQELGFESSGARFLARRPEAREKALKS
jgi:DNA-binding protein H-NS